MGKFNFSESPVKKVAEDIRDNNEQQTLTPNPLPLKGEGVITEPTAQPAPTVKAKKTENGIVINVPMADYMQLTMMKIQTGRTLKDLALQAIHEFVERNAVG